MYNNFENVEDFPIGHFQIQLTWKKQDTIKEGTRPFELIIIKNFFLKLFFYVGFS